MTAIKWKIFALALLLGVIGSIVYGVIDNKTGESALQNADTVVAVIVKKNPSRSHSDIFVQYPYKVRILHGEFSAESDTFKLRDKVILKIAKGNPEKYIQFLGKTK